MTEALRSLLSHLKAECSPAPVGREGFAAALG
jgi:hypothetical protein